MIAAESDAKDTLETLEEIGLIVENDQISN